MLLVVSMYLVSMAVNNVDCVLPKPAIISDVEFGDMKTLLSVNYYVLRMEEDLFIKGNIIYSDYCSMRTTDGKTISLIAGKPGTTGYIEGTGNFAQFSYIYGFHQVNASHVLVADNNNHCLRMVSRLTNHTYSFLGLCGSHGKTDGNNPSVRFQYPWSLVRDVNNKNKLVLSETGYDLIRQVDLEKRSVKTLFTSRFGNPTGMKFDGQNNLLIAHDCWISKYEPKVNRSTAVAGNGTCRHHNSWLDQSTFYTSRDVISLTNNTKVVADFNSHTLRVLDMKASWVRSICTPGVAGTTNGDVRSCRLNSPHSLLLSGDRLYIGQYEAIRYITVRPLTSSAASLPVCPPDELTVLSPDSAPLYTYTRPDINCTVRADISCPKNLELIANPVTEQADFQFDVDGATQHLFLPVGTHRQTVTYGSTNCSREIKVFTYNLKRRLDFKADYSVGCSYVEKSAALEMLKVVAKQRYAFLEEICEGKCLRSKDYQISMRCRNNTLTVIWPTNIVFFGDTIEVPKSFVRAVNMEFNGHKNYLDMVVLAHNPPLIFPTPNEDGLPVSLILTTVCADGSEYDNKFDTCVADTDI